MRAMAHRGPDQVRRWLERQPSLADVQREYPAHWQVVQAELAEVLEQGSLEAIQRYTAAVANPRPVVGRGGGDALVAAQVRQYLAATALRRMCTAAATGVRDGRLRFNLVNGFVAQRLLFAHDLERKPVGLKRFRLVWPLLWQRRYLMPLVEPRGIYCFYSRPLIARLAEIVAGRRALEIAAGDGTLSRFLTAAGVTITATDDHSWATSGVTYPDDVLRQDARTALREHAPEVVLCSWPPAGNPFERWVFRTPSVQTYIMIGSRHEFAAGHWGDYRRQTAFTFAEAPELSRLVLPPELDSAVYRFQRGDE
jgi:hypothetical protein